ncbi:RHS repeat domain-containing protein [Aquimarina sediminis]|uniref:hypothetical protein n=1 Tax=Aquimarina sediminis TaxID=2070536 RepID=UPI000CA03FE8|nr:hypothetical protein [Aquimarina sediminis]
MKYPFLRYLCVCIGVLLFQYTTAQQDYYGGYTPAATAAPAAAKTAKASSATVDLTTGAAQYAVPIYTISQNGVSWGVGLQYRYTGLKVLEQPSHIGLGWSLAATGMVSREVRGLPDDHPKGYYGSENIRQTILDPYYNFDPNNSPQTNGKKVMKEHDAYRLANGLIDGEPDLFHVSVGRLNFSFKLGLNGQPVLMSHHNVKVSFNWNSIEVIDSEGVTYVFAAKEVFLPKHETGGLFIPHPDAKFSYARSWYLTAIQPKNTNQQITFEYQNHLQKIKTFVPKIYSQKGRQSEFLYNLSSGVPVADGETDTHADPYIYSHIRLDVDVTVPVLKKINFAEGTLHFNTQAVAGGAFYQYANIQLKDFNNKLIHTYDWTTTGKRKLLTQIRRDSEFTFGFAYHHQNDANMMPDFEYNKEEVTSRMDKWGYYKGSKSQSNQITSGASDASSFESTVTGALKTITYKTGGATYINYESNTTNTNSSYGGIRVHTVQNCPEDTQQCTEKRYDYIDDSLASSGRDISWDGNPKNKSIFYSQVSMYNRYMDGDTEVKNGKTVYTFEDPNVFRYPSPPVSGNHNKPPTGQVEGGVPIKSVHTYKTNTDVFPYVDQLISEQTYEYEKVPAQVDGYGKSLNPNYPYGIRVQPTTGIKREWHIDQRARLFAESSHPQIPGSVLNLYIAPFASHYVNGTQAEFETYCNTLMSQVGISVNSGQWLNLQEYIHGVGTGASGENKHYKITAYKETNVLPRQKRVRGKTYSDTNPSDFSESMQEFTYDTYNQVVSQEQQDSKGVTKKATYYYPYHPQVNNTRLITDHRIASPVKTETFTGTKKQSTAVVNFAIWNAGYYLPANLQAAKENTPLTEQTIYHKYDDKGNPLEVSQGKSPHAVYIWGYHDVYPIAKIGNATYDQVVSYVADLKAKSNADIDHTLDYTGTEGALRQALDALRQALPNAVVTTYTYDPLIGMTSTTDPRGYTIYYEYDSKGRLIQNRDADKNILEKIYYDYADTENSLGYAPLEASITTFPTLGITTEPVNFNASVQGGSPNHTYKWEFEAPNGTITTVNQLAFPFTFNQSHVGEVTVRFKATDNVTGITKSVTRKVTVYAAYNVDIQFASPVKVNTNATFTAISEGGSGNYSYSWSINRTNSPFLSTQKSFNVKLGYDFYGTNRWVTCDVTDNVTGRTFHLVKPLTVNQATVSQSWSSVFSDINSSYHNQRFKVHPSSGSGQYTYKWKGSDGREWSGDTFSVYLDKCRESKSIECTVTDKITGAKHTKRMDFYFFPSRCNNVDPIDPGGPGDHPH